MKIESKISRYPVAAGWVRVFLGVAVFVAAGVGVVFGDPWKWWLLAMNGVLVILSGVRQLRADDVIQIVIDDREIRFRTRKGNDTVIDRGSVVDTEVLRRSILLYFDGPGGIRSVSLRLRQFLAEDAATLREAFAERYPQCGGT